MRHRLYEIIEPAGPYDTLSKLYDFFMIAMILLSLYPLAFKSTNSSFVIIEIVVVPIFVIDYLFRLITADYRADKKPPVSFIKYPFTPMAIIDLLSILPSLLGFTQGLKLLRLFRLFRTFRVFRVFKLFRYSRNVKIIVNVFKKQKDALLCVLVLALGYIVVSALIVFNVEPSTFDHFFEAIYWATVSLTTMGYGDIYPVTMVGRFFTMISSLFGIAIIALPAGIIAAGYLAEIIDNGSE